VQFELSRRQCIVTLYSDDVCAYSFSYNQDIYAAVIAVVNLMVVDDVDVVLADGARVTDASSSVHFLNRFSCLVESSETI
jgi:hypothetical protein